MSTVYTRRVPLDYQLRYSTDKIHWSRTPPAQNGGEPDPGPIDVTNSEKLALTGISVGQVVHITDAVQVAGGTQDGVYVYNGLAHGKAVAYLIGQPVEDFNNEKDVYWSSDEVKWFVYDGTALGILYYSLSDTLTADLATDWKNQSDDTPALITVVNPAVQQYLGGGTGDEANWQTI